MEPDDILASYSRGDITEAQGFSLFRSYLEREFPKEKLSKLLNDICSAEDIHMTKDGDTWVSPNWMARVKGFENAVKILHSRMLENQKGPTASHPTQIVFNVITKQGGKDGDS